MGFHSIGLRPFGVPRTVAWIIASGPGLDNVYASRWMNVPRRMSEPLDPLPEIVEPANAFLFLNRNAGLIFFLSCPVPQLFRVQNFTATSRSSTVTARLHVSAFRRPYDGANDRPCSIPTAVHALG